MYDTVDWYEVLRISPEATDDDIRQAWRYKVKEAHPDTNGATDAEERTKLINIAKEILMDRDKRQAFDLRRAQWKRQEEEAKRQKEYRRRRQAKKERITREQVLEVQLEIERKHRMEAEEKLRGMGWYELQEELQKERKLREQAERKLRFEEEFDSGYRHLYDEQERRAEQAEKRVDNAEQKVRDLEDLLEELRRDLGIQVYETQPYRRPYRLYNFE